MGSDSSRNGPVLTYNNIFADGNSTQINGNIYGNVTFNGDDGKQLDGMTIGLC